MITEQRKHALLIEQAWDLIGLKTTEQWIDDMNDRHGEKASLVGTRAIPPQALPVTVDLEEVGK